MRAPNMHETKCRGAQDLRVVKVSASYDAWRPKNAKDENNDSLQNMIQWKSYKIKKELIFFEEQRNGRYHQILPGNLDI